MLMIESGSTCALFAEQLAKTKKNVTIITNSVFLADYVKGYPNIELILLGGTLQPHSQSLVGLLTKNSAASFHVDKLFAGTDGYSRDFGFTGDDLARSDTLSAMTECADHVYILTDSGKFSHPGAVSFLPLQDVYEVITDEGLPKEEQDFLLSQGIRVFNCLNTYKNHPEDFLCCTTCVTKRSPPEIFLIFLCVLLSCLS